MTPAARVCAAIGILDQVLSGRAAEQALTNWARGSRFAGSGDRAAVRDLVFDALRRKRSLGLLGGGEDGRALMIGQCRLAGVDPGTVFTGERHAPAPLSEVERGWAPRENPPRASLLDVQDWVLAELEVDLGPATQAVLEAMRHRAPVFLRVNLLRGDLVSAAAALKTEGIATVPHPLAATALEVTSNARRIRGNRAWAEGRVELQDAASQAVVALVAERSRGARVLDYCAGGGGKALALAAYGAAVTAHDIDPRRMSDLPERARRAGASVAVLGTRGLEAAAPWDLVFVDAPCSGSGAWRRQVDAKWRLRPDDLDRLATLQSEILAAAAGLVRPGGTLLYATCSILARENTVQIDRFRRSHPGWSLDTQRQFLPTEGGDGFFAAVLTRHSS